MVILQLHYALGHLHKPLAVDIDECASGAVCLGMYEVCVNTPGHYKCECARFFRRDPVTGQCQPDPAIYSQYAPKRAEAKTEEKAEEKATGGETRRKNTGDGKTNLETEFHDEYHHGSNNGDRKCSSSQTCSPSEKPTEEEDSLSEEDIKRILVALIICVLGTAAAKGSMLWTSLFFLSLILAMAWWASDKTDRIAQSMMNAQQRRGS